MEARAVEARLEGDGGMVGCMGLVIGLEKLDAAHTIAQVGGVKGNAHGEPALVSPGHPQGF